MTKIKPTLNDIKFDRGVDSIAVQRAPRYNLPGQKGVISSKGAAVPNMVNELFLKKLKAPWQIIDDPETDIGHDLLDPPNFDRMVFECAKIFSESSSEAYSVLKSLQDDRELIKKCINLLRKA